MASIRQRNGRFQVQIRLNGETRSATFDSRQEAKRWAIRIEADMIGNMPGAGLYKPAHMAEILTRYLQRESPKKPGYHVEKYIIKKLLREKWVYLPLERLTSSILADYRDRRLQEIKASSFNRQFSVLRVACAIARDEWCWDFDDKFLRIRRAKVSSERIPRRVSSSEFQQLLLACYSCKTGRLRHVLVLALETGMRRGELCALTKSAVSLDEGLIKVEFTKTGFSRVIPITAKAEVAIKALFAMSSNDRLLDLTPNAIRMGFNRVRARAGLRHIRFHDLRHEAVSRFFELGLTPPEVAAISGHRTLSMLMRYSHASLTEISRKLGSNIGG
jgi:integrase